MNILDAIVSDCVHHQMEASKYSEGVSWLHDVMYHLKPSVARLRVKTAKLLNSIADDKKSGPMILALIHKRALFDNGG